MVDLCHDSVKWVIANSGVLQGGKLGVPLVKNGISQSPDIFLTSDAALCDDN